MRNDLWLKLILATALSSLSVHAAAEDSYFEYAPKRGKTLLYDVNDTENKQLAPRRLLSFDGGGIRGIISLKIAKKIQERLGEPLVNQTDVLSGTSTGGLIALALADGHSLDAILDLYENNGNRIFCRGIRKSLSSLFGLTDEKYETGPLEEEIKSFFGEETRLSTLSFANAIVPSANITTLEPQLFSSYKALKNSDDDFDLWFVARSTSAAPTYFEPTKFGKSALVDGGIIANNPSVYASLHIKEQFGWDALKNLKVVSIGTGFYNSTITYKTARSMGALEWAVPITSTMMNTASNLYDSQMQMLFSGTENYLRLQPVLATDIPLDDISSNAINEMESVAEAFIHNNTQLIDHAVQLLR